MQEEGKEEKWVDGSEGEGKKEREKGMGEHRRKTKA